jgi:hypothetical protein
MLTVMCRWQFRDSYLAIRFRHTPPTLRSKPGPQNLGMSAVRGAFSAYSADLFGKPALDGGAYLAYLAIKFGHPPEWSLR